MIQLRERLGTRRAPAATMRSAAHSRSNISLLAVLSSTFSLACVLLEGSTDGAQGEEPVSAGAPGAASAAGGVVGGSASGGSAGQAVSVGGGGAPAAAGTGSLAGSSSSGGSGLPIGAFGATTCLNADGNKSDDTYALIGTVFAPGSVENPDLDHPDPIRHVWEETDASVGDHFVFGIHRDVDLDGANTDRQRVEMKAYDRSASSLKGFQNQTMSYSWRFQVNPNMGFSESFTHLFQLKAVDGDDDTPLITLSGATRHGDDRIEIRHSPSSGQDVISDASWAGLRGQWLEVFVRATFAESGAFEMTVKKVDGGTVLSVSQNLDLWRDGASFVRPKWGIYRSLVDKHQLRAEEETVRFANIAVTSGAEPSTNCR